MTYNGNSFHLRLFYTTPPEQRKTFVWRLFPIVHYMVGWPEEIWKASRANYNWEEEGNWGEQRWPLIQVTIVFHLFMHNNSRASAISVSGVFAIYHFSLLEATYRLKQQDKLIEWDAFTPMTKLIKGVQITAKAYESFYKSSLLRIFLCYPKINNQTIDLVQNFFFDVPKRGSPWLRCECLNGGGYWLPCTFKTPAKLTLDLRVGFLCWRKEGPMEYQ